MTDLYWPGDNRAANLMTQSALLAAMVTVESAWLDALTTVGIAPAEAAFDLCELVGDEDILPIATASEDGGNPVIPLVDLLRGRLMQLNPAASRWVHRGLTSQDVLDTALVLCLKDVLEQVDGELAMQIGALAGLASEHRAAPMVGRTLTQHAVPITFGLKSAVWLQGVLDAADDLHALNGMMASQFGGAAGTLAALTELATLAGLSEAPYQADKAVALASSSLGLQCRTPWHTSRAPIARIGDRLVGCTSAWGHIANDVLLLSRPEIAEVAEPAIDGRGSSSTMPQKTNPILSVLIRRAALAAPVMGSLLHLASADAVDERAPGSWHIEWATLRDLGRRTAVAASQATELLTGLSVDLNKMQSTIGTAGSGVLAEKQSIASLFEDVPTDDTSRSYLGTTDLIIDAAIKRADTYLKDSS